MAHKETFHLPSVMLEVGFAGDEGKVYDLKEFRSGLKSSLMKRLIADGVAFQERVKSEHWKMGEGPDAKLESLVDAWILANKYVCPSKEKAKLGGKVRWVLECEEQVTILMEPNE